MFIVISPAKSLDFENKNCFNPSTLPFFQKETQELIEICKKFDAPEISRLMKVSDSIASLNVARFNDFSKNYDKKNSFLLCRNMFFKNLMFVRLLLRPFLTCTPRFGR